MEANLASSGSFKDDGFGGVVEVEVEPLSITVWVLVLQWDRGFSGDGEEEASEKGLNLRKAYVARVVLQNRVERMCEQHSARSRLWRRSLEAIVEMRKGRADREGPWTSVREEGELGNDLGLGRAANISYQWVHDVQAQSSLDGPAR